MRMTIITVRIHPVSKSNSKRNQSQFNCPSCKLVCFKCCQSNEMAISRIRLESTPSSAISSIQPCNFSSTEHSVTRLRGRVLVSSTKDQCRDFILTFRCPRAHARDLMSMAKCQNNKAQDCMPETLQYKARTGEVLHRMLIYWRIVLRSAPQNGIIEAHLAKWKPVRRRRNKKTPQNRRARQIMQTLHLWLNL